tara:strand:- start:104 stop:625 length:522 start_codon:yes stop_codon:yes gene_type:complete
MRTFKEAYDIKHKQELTDSTTFDDLMDMKQVICYHVSDFNLTKESIERKNLHVGPLTTSEYRADYKWAQLGEEGDQYLYKVVVNLDKLYPELYEYDDPEENTSIAESKGFSVMAYLNLFDDYNPDGSMYNEVPAGPPPLALVILDPSAINNIQKVKTLFYDDWYKEQLNNENI